MKTTNENNQTNTDLQNDFIAIDDALAVIGYKRVLPLMRCLVDKPLRYCDLKRMMGITNSQLLSDPLKIAINNNLIHTIQPDLDKEEEYYTLTKHGRDSLSLLIAIIEFGKKNKQEITKTTEPKTLRLKFLKKMKSILLSFLFLLL